MKPTFNPGIPKFGQKPAAQNPFASQGQQGAQQAPAQNPLAQKPQQLSTPVDMLKGFDCLA